MAFSPVAANSDRILTLPALSEDPTRNLIDDVFGVIFNNLSLNDYPTTVRVSKRWKHLTINFLRSREHHRLTNLLRHTLNSLGDFTENHPKASEVRSLLELTGNRGLEILKTALNLKVIHNTLIEQRQNWIERVGFLSEDDLISLTSQPYSHSFPAHLEEIFYLVKSLVQIKSVSRETTTSQLETGFRVIDGLALVGKLHVAQDAVKPLEPLDVPLFRESSKKPINVSLALKVYVSVKYSIMGYWQMRNDIIKSVNIDIDYYSFIISMIVNIRLFQNTDGLHFSCDDADKLANCISQDETRGKALSHIARVWQSRRPPSI